MTAEEGSSPVADVRWDEMRWVNPPPSAKVEDDVLAVVTGPETDFWRTTSYGFIHDNGHFLGTPLVGDAGVELTFAGEFTAQFDHAGLMLRSGPDLWLKAGVELTDGDLFASVVVTIGRSDWSVAPVALLRPDSPITIRASRVGDSVTIRYGVGPGAELRLLRVAHLPEAAAFEVGPFCCSPTRCGLVVRFEPMRIGQPDAHLHAV
jgi:regulation of enolase protein 1 (concanavalin A-like superfamily)